MTVSGDYDYALASATDDYGEEELMLVDGVSYLRDPDGEGQVLEVDFSNLLPEGTNLGPITGLEEINPQDGLKADH